MDRPRHRTISFRAMTLSDLSQIEQVENSSFSAPWSRQAFVDELVHNQFAAYTVITVDGDVVGYCGCWLILDEAHITNLAIHPDYRGKGLGEAALTYVMGRMKRQGASKMFLEVRVSNQAAQSLYQKLGFTCSGIRHGYYADNQEDAILMWVRFDEEAERRNTGTGY
jgi:[ribosomal protein S18]-alanine N-acetyltransferase